jgi:hypothetical protein
MDHLVIEGFRPYDGRYELGGNLGDFYASLTAREWGWIKRYSGTRPPAFFDELRQVDAELIAVLAVIVLRRGGKVDADAIPDLYDRIADKPRLLDGVITFEFSPIPDEDADASPPAGSSGGSTSGPGTNGKTSSASSDGTPPATGTPASDTSVSVPIRWGN